MLIGCFQSKWHAVRFAAAGHLIGRADFWVLAAKVSVEAKAKFLESKGVDSYAIAQASCVSLGAYDAFGPVMWELYK